MISSQPLKPTTIRLMPYGADKPLSVDGQCLQGFGFLGRSLHFSPPTVLCYVRALGGSSTWSGCVWRRSLVDKASLRSQRGTLYSCRCWDSYSVAGWRSGGERLPSIVPRGWSHEWPPVFDSTQRRSCAPCSEYTSTSSLFLSLLPKVKSELQRMVELGIIEEVTAPTAWVSSMVPVPKHRSDV